VPINFAIKLAATVAIEAVQIGLQATRRTYGPRLSETQVTTADYGTPLPCFLGARLLQGQIVWSRDLEIVEHTHKIKGGGKQTNQSALWTGGVALSDCRGSGGPIEKILKVWLDETLAYDATGPGPVSYASSIGVDLAAVMRVYTGAEDQLPDPAYVDYCEERYGPNSAPAFRGTSMLVFDRFPCDNFGNRVPQIRVLAVSAATTAYPYETHLNDNTDWLTAAVSQDGLRLLIGTPYEGTTGKSFEIWDLPTRTMISQGDLTPVGTLGAGASISENWALDSAGRIWSTGYSAAGPANHFLWCWPPDGNGPPIVQTHIGDATTAVRVNDTSGEFIVLMNVNSTANYMIATVPEGGITDHATSGWLPSCYCTDSDGAAWLAGTDGASMEFHFEKLFDGAGSFDVDLGEVPAGNYALRHYADAETDQFVLFAGAKMYFIDRQTQTLTGTAPFTGANIFANISQQPTGASTVIVDGGGASIKEYSLKDGSVATSLGSSWTGGSWSSGIYDAVNDAWIGYSGSMGGSGHAGIRWYFLHRSASAGTTLGTIVSAMCDTAGLEDRDTSLLTQSVAGYSWTRGDVKSQMEPLLDIYDVDACPHDFTIKFKPRGSAPSGTILTPDFAKSGDDAPRYKISEAQDTDLPRILRVNFADTGFDQEANNILSPLPVDTVDSQRDVTIDLTTMAASPDTAQQLADRYMRRAWNGKDTIDLSLTSQEEAIEPGDVKTLSLDGTLWNAKLEKQAFVGSRMDCTFRRDEEDIASLNSATTGPSMDGRDPEVVSFPAPVRGFVVDAPLRWDSDSDSRPLLFSGAGAFAGLTFPGGAIWEETGAGDSAAYDQLFATVRSGATWGTCSEALADVPSPWLWDRGNTVKVTLQNGSLTNASEDDIDADPSLNLLLVGRPGAWEYVNFTTATLNGDGSYTLSGFKRGRRGTEWACGEHQAGDAFVLASSLDVDEVGADDVGAVLSFKAQSLGRSVDSAAAIDLSPFTGRHAQALRAGADHLEHRRHGPDRRDRAQDADRRLLERRRTHSAFRERKATRSTSRRGGHRPDDRGRRHQHVHIQRRADLAADGNSLGECRPSVNVYQMSDTVGRGFALAA
jgi:hypothetical protein